MLADIAKSLPAAKEAVFEPALEGNYPRFDAMMEKHGYYWEAMRVTTADDYILTTFHVLGKIGI